MAVTTPIYDFLRKHVDKQPISFHMPGHKGSELFRKLGYGDFLDHIMDSDITEIDGADNLFQTEGIIKDAQEKYAKLYGVKKSYLLINGTSGGIIASILASVNKGKKIIMARNCHKSVFNALTLGDIQPVYAYPEMIKEYQILGPISPNEIERLLQENPDAEAVIFPSPNYYGICSDIKTIASIVHKYGKILIVDEAHGAHLKFSHALPMAAVDAHADIVINSIHKTLASFTQSAVLHLNSDRVDQYLLEDKLQCIESTSPSYLLMASLDISASILEEFGEDLMNSWINNLDSFYQQIEGISGLKVMNLTKGFDRTKINLSMRDLGLSGSELEKILMKDYSIFMELNTGDLVMGMSGIGNTKEDFDRLANALLEISRNLSKDRLSSMKKNNLQDTSCLKQYDYTLPKQPQMFELPTIKRLVKLADSDGLICASSIIPYPPGIPLICPGERIDPDAIAYIQALRASGEKVIGINEFGEVIVGV